VVAKVVQIWLYKNHISMIYYHRSW